MAPVAINHSAASIIPARFVDVLMGLMILTGTKKIFSRVASSNQ
jgi:hypothetical protein